MFALGLLFYLGLLLLNAVAILNEQRFLARIGWSSGQATGFPDPNQSIKARLVNLISAVRTLLRHRDICLNYKHVPSTLL
ncbi:hypothetical protein H4R34_001798 [Dimargaris verticillata]|uniref:Yos1-like protein n=1 Tax=Dimargaris verticillata TaxID=2761393 RepID=A0A9W8EAK2_9FUNG|nr:hypothetical protein H4R34_001798 [Dimargaris verticillata]